MAPAREPFVQRGEYAKVGEALLADGAGRATTVGITTAIHGAGGFGKTALALELCYDERVREQYPDGILWTTMGEEIDPAGCLARIRDLIRWWTEKDPPAFETVSAASAHLRQELNGKRVLLVVDDVWSPEDITPFQGLGSRAALLATTRDSRTLPVGSARFHVDAMEIPEAVQLLSAGLPAGVDTELRTLAVRLGEWPLLLKIVNRQLWELTQQDGLSREQSLREVNEALDSEGLTVFDREDLESCGQAVARTVGASLRRLSEEEVSQFGQLAIFPEDKDIPLLVLEKLWGLGSFATKKLCSRLHDRSLLLRFDRSAGTIRLHDVIRAYLQKKGDRQLVEWHRRLLNAFRPTNGRWPDLPRDESYLWNHLFQHLMGAGQSDVCQGLLLDFQYLGSKLGATDINALLADYSAFADKDEELRLVRDALRLSAHVLARTAAQLAGQLLGRLLDRQEERIQRLLRECEGAGPWLRPHGASLAQPGGALISTIEHPGEPPQALAVLSESRFVSGSYDGTLRVWDVENGQLLQTLQGHSRGVSTVAVLGSRHVVSGSYDGTLRVWDVESGQTLQTLQGHSGGVGSVAVLDSRHVVSGYSYGSLRVWDVKSGQTLQAQEFPYGVSAVAVLDSRHVVFGFDYGALRLWDVERGQELQTFEGHSGLVRALAVLGSHHLISASTDGTLRVWDVGSGQTLQTLQGHSGEVNAVAVLDSRHVVSGSSDGTLRVWDVESGQTLQTLEGHLGPIRAVAVLECGHVISAHSDGILRVWDVEKGQTLQTFQGRSGGVDTVAVLDSHHVISGSSDHGTLCVWDVERGQTLQTLQCRSGSVSAVAVLDSRRVVTGSSDRTLRVWDVKSGQTLQTLEGHHGCIRAVAVLDPHHVISGSDDRTLCVWDVESGQTLQTLIRESGYVRALAVLDGRHVVDSGFFDGTLVVWDMESGQRLLTLRGHSSWVSAVVVLDSRHVVSSSSDGTLRLWDVESGQTLQTLEGHSDTVNAVAVLGGHRVVSGSDDRTLRVWNVESGETECLFTLDSPVAAVAVIPDRRIIVAGDRSGRIHFFDFVEG